MDKIKKINEKDLLFNLNECKSIFTKIKENIPIIINDNPSIEFKELDELNLIVNEIKKSMNNINNNIQISNEKMVDFTDYELDFFSKKTNISKQTIQNFVEFSQNINTFDLKKEFDLTKEKILETFKETENKKSIEILQKRLKNQNNINENILSGIDLLDLKINDKKLDNKINKDLDKDLDIDKDKDKDLDNKVNDEIEL